MYPLICVECGEGYDWGSTHCLECGGSIVVDDPPHNTICVGCPDCKGIRNMPEEDGALV